MARLAGPGDRVARRPRSSGVSPLYRRLRDIEEAKAVEPVDDRGGRHLVREHQIRLAQLRAGYPVEVHGVDLPAGALPPVKCARLRRLVVWPNGRIDVFDRPFDSREFLFEALGEGDWVSPADYAGHLYRRYYS